MPGASRTKKQSSSGSEVLRRGSLVLVLIIDNINLIMIILI